MLRKHRNCFGAVLNVMMFRARTKPPLVLRLPAQEEPLLSRSQLQEWRWAWQRWRRRRASATSVREKAVHPLSDKSSELHMGNSVAFFQLSGKFSRNGGERRPECLGRRWVSVAIPSGPPQGLLGPAPSPYTVLATLSTAPTSSLL